MTDPAAVPPPRPSFVDRALSTIERVGNKLPDPAMIFVWLLLGVWVLSFLMSSVTYEALNRVTGQIETRQIQNMLSGTNLTAFLTSMVHTFVTFHPLGVVLVALLGIGVAEHSGFINAGLKWMLGFTPRLLLTPMLVFVAIISHTAADAGYVLVIPLGGVIFYAAGRHPLAGITAAFAGVSGGFGANFVISGIDPLLQGITQAGAQVLDASRTVNPLCNWYFCAASSVLVILVAWFVTDRIVEPRLKNVVVDCDPADLPKFEPLAPVERRGLVAALISMLIGFGLLALACLPAESPLRFFNRADPTDPMHGSLVATGAPLMQSIVPLIFLLSLLPGVVYGVVAKTIRSHKDVVKGMSKSMSTMGYYLVMAFCASLFIKAFTDSGLGAWIAVQGATQLKAMALPAQITVVLMILMTATVNLLIGSASAKWALLAPIFVPMMMEVQIAPELTQAAYRVGDSTTNILTPLMPYFPLVVVYAQKYAKGTGLGTLVSLMLPYSIAILSTWTVFLLLYWSLDLPLGVGGAYRYP